MIVNKKSWHYRLLLWCELGLPHRIPNDFCGYWRKLVLYILLFVFLVAVVCFLLFVFLAMPYVVGGWEVGLIIHGVTLGVGGIAALLALGIERLYKLQSSEPGLVRTAYRSWKEKYCPILEFKDD